MIFKASTVTKRIGVIFVLLSLISLSVFSIHWNITKRPFIYQETLREYNPDTTMWYVDKDLLSEKEVNLERYIREKIPLSRPCVQSRIGNMSIYSIGAGTRLKTASNCIALPYKTTPVWRSSLPDFLKVVFTRGKIWIPAMLLIGLFLMSGFPENVYTWIKTGSWPKPIDSAVNNKKLLSKFRHANKRQLLRIFLGLVLFILAITLALVFEDQSNVISKVLYQASIGGVVGGIVMICYELYRLICSMGRLGRVLQKNIRIIIGLLLLLMFVLPWLIIR